MSPAGLGYECTSVLPMNGVRIHTGLQYIGIVQSCGHPKDCLKLLMMRNFDGFCGHELPVSAFP
jgi:hypothetical protein